MIYKNDDCSLQYELKQHQMLNSSDPYFFNYKKLFCAILIRLTYDIKSKNKSTNSIKHFKKIPQLLEGDTFEFICDCLNINHGLVKKFLLEKLENEQGHKTATRRQSLRSPQIAIRKQ